MENISWRKSWVSVHRAKKIIFSLIKQAIEITFSLSLYADFPLRIILIRSAVKSRPSGRGGGQIRHIVEEPGTGPVFSVLRGGTGEWWAIRIQRERAPPGLRGLIEVVRQWEARSVIFLHQLLPAGNAFHWERMVFRFILYCAMFTGVHWQERIHERTHITQIDIQHCFSIPRNTLSLIPPPGDLWWLSVCFRGDSFHPVVSFLPGSDFFNFYFPRWSSLIIYFLRVCYG